MLSRTIINALASNCKALIWMQKKQAENLLNLNLNFTLNLFEQI